MITLKIAICALLPPGSWLFIFAVVVVTATGVFTKIAAVLGILAEFKF